MNQQVGMSIRRKARPINRSSRVEQFYRAQLRLLVQRMGRAVAESVVPVLNAEKHNFTDAYEQGLCVVRGVRVFIENEAGSRRHADWAPLNHHYGHIKGTVGADKEHIDVFISDDAADESLPVFIIDQVKKDGSFDEHKVLIGFKDIKSAGEAYLSNYPAGWTLGNITEMSMDDFRSWIQYGDTTTAITRDAAFMDGWIERVIAALALSMASFQEGVFASHAERLASSTVSMTESETTKAFLESVNRAVGVDMTHVIGNEGLSDYIEAAAHENAQLIKSIPQEYFTDIQSAVIGGIRNGDAPSKIIKTIRAKTEATYNRAKLIARDQTAKLTSEINEQRQTNAGIKYYRSVDSGDERVSGRPGGKYPNAKISCWAIARQDIGYGPGVYRWDTGASYGGQTGLHPGKHHIQCRCTASPVFEWEVEDE
jgi:SPP1 gp7 family putative phage head morphogenesis protein